MRHTDVPLVGKSGRCLKGLRLKPPRPCSHAEPMIKPPSTRHGEHPRIMPGIEVREPTGVSDKNDPSAAAEGRLEIIDVYSIWQHLMLSVWRNPFERREIRRSHDSVREATWGHHSSRTGSNAPQPKNARYDRISREGKRDGGERGVGETRGRPSRVVSPFGEVEMAEGRLDGLGGW